MKQSLMRGIRTLCSRRIYLFMILIVPLGCAFFFLSLMHTGLPQKAPVVMVDLDHSSMSRQLTRQLSANELIDIRSAAESYSQALDQVRSGQIYGFFCIPRDFEKDALSGRTPTLSFSSNMAFFVPGTLLYKGLKTAAVTTSGGVVQTTLTMAGVDGNTLGNLTMPMRFDTHPIANPWVNYNVYLSQSFLAGMVALLVLLVTCFSICQEFKQGTSPQWLATAGGSMVRALVGKLLPQTVAFTAVGVAIQAVMFVYMGFPMHCPAWHMVLAMALLVMASQAFAVAVCEAVPNLRLSLSVCSLVGILCFSIAGFSFPVDKMYGGAGIFAYIVPIRYYFLIYIDQALNGLPLYWSRWYYVALLCFMLVPAAGLRRLKGRCLDPVYVP